MDQQSKLKGFVEERARHYGIGEFSNQRTIIQEQLMQIEDYFQKILFEQKQTLKKIKVLTKINVSSVSSATGIQRSTIYNNSNTLQAYIDKRTAEIIKEDILGVNRTQKIKIKNSDFDNLFDGLQQQLVDNFELTIQIQELEKELKSLFQQKEDDYKNIFRLEQENNKLRRLLNNPNKDTVVPLRKDQ
ncbi:hypothetical protein [Bacillus sp. ISL-39]|uniref:hypothetical protein n=1 Tax=Bacillus sp. ISL-39 TaxID=2819124 RepID=UPI001BE4EDF0|nr:hypothetical protein [Bacillus sp. ISL-39]MBT2636587.1 hypothetical protein [Bacillus sp. ISL-39]